MFLRLGRVHPISSHRYGEDLLPLRSFIRPFKQCSPGDDDEESYINGIMMKLNNCIADYATTSQFCNNNST